ncbi:MAG: hypothetical protein AAFX99_24335, partial [Myxococcota bacterium]
DIKVVGREVVPEEGPLIFAANHLDVDEIQLQSQMQPVYNESVERGHGDLSTLTLHLPVCQTHAWLSTHLSLPCMD